MTDTTTVYALDGVKLQRTSMYNYRFRFPNGAVQDATMTEVLLWEMLHSLQYLEGEVADLKQTVGTL